MSGGGSRNVMETLERATRWAAQQLGTLQERVAGWGWGRSRSEWEWPGGGKAGSNLSLSTAMYIAPPAALCAHTALSLVVMAPRTAARLFPKHDITNFLVITSFTGTSIWLWKRPHISGTPPGRRFPWVFLGSSTYVLGSILMWAIIRSAVGRHTLLSVSLGLTTGAALTYTAIDYFNYLDKDFEPLVDITDNTNHSDDENYDLDL